jgi:hypothetical protein
LDSRRSPGESRSAVSSRWTLGLAAILVFDYGPVPAKAIVLALAAIVLPWWFFRVYLDR